MLFFKNLQLFEWFLLFLWLCKSNKINVISVYRKFSNGMWESNKDPWHQYSGKAFSCSSKKRLSYVDGRSFLCFQRLISSQLIVVFRFEGNGTLYVKPFEKPMDRNCWTDPTNKISVYNSTDPPDETEEGIALNMEPGDILIFSSFLWHRSSPNTSSEVRRVLMPQFSTIHLKYEDEDGEQQYERFAVECFDQ